MIQLVERSVQAIKNFNEGEIEDYNALLFFEIYYEIEYKYSMLTTRPFGGIERRRQNILEIIQDTGEYVMGELRDSFIVVFNEWLDNHAINDPEKWAERWFGFEEVDELGMEELVHSFIDNLESYGLDYTAFLYEIEENILRGNFPITKEVLEDVNAEDDIEELSLLRDRGIEEYLKDYNIETLYPFSEGEKGLLLSMDSMDKGYAVEMLQEWGEYILFPLWYGFWKAQGIDETRENIERLHNSLFTLDRFSFQQKLGIINQAINASHQNGSMMEYYEERYDVGPVELNRLSEQNVEEWNAELREIGVEV